MRCLSRLCFVETQLLNSVLLGRSLEPPCYPFPLIFFYFLHSKLTKSLNFVSLMNLLCCAWCLGLTCYRNKVARSKTRNEIGNFSCSLVRPKEDEIWIDGWTLFFRDFCADLLAETEFIHELLTAKMTNLPLLSTFVDLCCLSYCIFFTDFIVFLNFFH
jgi:hypothetical protein